MSEPHFFLPRFIYSTDYDPASVCDFFDSVNNNIHQLDFLSALLRWKSTLTLALSCRAEWRMACYTQERYGMMLNSSRLPLAPKQLGVVVASHARQDCGVV